MKMRFWAGLAGVALAGSAAFGQIPIPTNSAGATPTLLSAPSPAVTATNSPAAKSTAKAKKKKSAPAKAPAAKAAKAKAAPAGEASATNSPALREAHLLVNPPESALVTKDHINVRGQAGLLGETITHLRKGENVTVLEEINLSKPKKDEPAQWLRIAMPTNTPVWVSADFIDTNSMTASKRVNVRGGPGENFSVVARLDKGTAVKEIRRVDNWFEIETPASAFAFVAAEFLQRQVTTPAAPPPSDLRLAQSTPVAKPITDDPSLKPNPVAADPVPETKPALQNTDPVRTPEAPVVQSPAPAPVQEPAPKRVVTREGRVARSINLQTPSYFELESSDNGRVVDYLHVDREKHPDFDLHRFLGAKIVVTGEEGIDKRWPRTPVLEIDSIELQ
jgi:uncharacterized protein YgiM (DUF1202 family)